MGAIKKKKDFQGLSLYLFYLKVMMSEIVHLALLPNTYATLYLLQCDNSLYRSTHCSDNKADSDCVVDGNIRGVIAMKITGRVRSDMLKYFSFFFSALM